MKKLGFLLIFVFLLAGCDIGGLSDKLTKELLSSSTSEETSKRSTDSSGEESVESESVIENNELFSSTQKASDNENLEELLLVPQADEIK